MQLLCADGFLEACGPAELAALARRLRPSRHAQFAEHVVQPGDRLDALHVLASGACRVVVRAAANTSSGAGGDSEEEYTAHALSVGDCFGHGALLGAEGVCSYAAEVGVVVDSMTAEFLILDRRGLEKALPSHIVEDVRKRLKVQLPQDPIRADAQRVVDHELEWRRFKRRFVAEVQRSSASGGRVRGAASEPCIRPWLPVGPLQRRLAAPLSRTASGCSLTGGRVGATACASLSGRLGSSSSFALARSSSAPGSRSCEDGLPPAVQARRQALRKLEDSCKSPLSPPVRLPGFKFPEILLECLPSAGGDGGR